MADMTPKPNSDQLVEQLMLRTAQQQQIIDQYRVDIYQATLRLNLLIKMIEEKGVMVKDEFEKRWPLYMKNDVGYSPNGVMEGSLKVTFWG